MLRKTLKSVFPPFLIIGLLPVFSPHDLRHLVPGEQFPDVPHGPPHTSFSACRQMQATVNCLVSIQLLSCRLGILREGELS